MARPKINYVTFTYVDEIPRYFEPELLISTVAIDLKAGHEMIVQTEPNQRVYECVNKRIVLKPNIFMGISIINMNNENKTFYAPVGTTLEYCLSHPFMKNRFASLDCREDEDYSNIYHQSNL